MNTASDSANIHTMRVFIVMLVIIVEIMMGRIPMIFQNYNQKGKGGGVVGLNPISSLQ